MNGFQRAHHEQISTSSPRTDFNGLTMNGFVYFREYRLLLHFVHRNDNTPSFLRRQESRKVDPRVKPEDDGYTIPSFLRFSRERIIDLNIRSMHSYATRHRNGSKSIYGSTSSPRTDFDKLTTNGLRQAHHERTLIGSP